MVTFKIISDQTVLDVSVMDSLVDIEFFLLSFDMGSINRHLPFTTYGYPVYCQDEQIGWVALSDSNVGGLVVHHYTLARNELQRRWDIKAFYLGEHENSSPF